MSMRAHVLLLALLGAFSVLIVHAAAQDDGDATEQTTEQDEMAELAELMGLGPLRRSTDIDPRKAYKSIIRMRHVDTVEILPTYWGTDVGRVVFKPERRGRKACPASYPPLFIKDDETCPDWNKPETAAQYGYEVCGYSRLVPSDPGCAEPDPFGWQPKGYVPCDYNSVRFFVEESRYCPRERDIERPPAGYDLCFEISEGGLDPERFYYYPAEWSCDWFNEPPAAIMGPTDDRFVYTDATPEEQRAAAATAMVLRNSVINETDVSNRVLLDNDPQAPALCADQRFAQLPQPGFCSAFKIGDRQVATAAHCVRTARQCRNTSFVFNFFSVDETGANQSSLVSADDIYACERVVEYRQPPIGTRGADWAVVEVDREIDAPMVTIAEAGAIEPYSPVTIIGYPLGFPAIITRESEVDGIASEYFITRADTFVGNSGSAVFDSKALDDGALKVIGLLSRGEYDFEDFKEGEDSCLSVRYCPDMVCRGEDATLAHFLKAFQQTEN